MNKPIRLAIAMAVAAVPGAAIAMDPPGYTAPYTETLETLNFPLFAMLRVAPDWAEALRSDPALAELAKDRSLRSDAAPNCTPRPACLADAWTWTARDIATVDAALRRIAAVPARAHSLVGRHMRPSGRFARHAALDDAALLSAAWSDTAAGVNRMIAVYGKGAAPRYPKIDAIIFDTAAKEFAPVLDAHGQVTQAMARPDDLFFDGALRYATGLLRLNERVEAGAFRPMLGGENASAVAAVARMNWRGKPYSALLVFGHGPDDPRSRTGVMGHIRMAMAADLFARGLAPFLIVSGGNVHPNRTPFNEAVEMKKVLIAQYRIPAERILIEPHARHTTTNQRNTARLLFAAGFPTDRPALIVTDPTTARYIGGSELAARNLAEMGVQPGRIAPGPAPFTFAFHPSGDAFHVDVTDPLDP